MTNHGDVPGRYKWDMRKHDALLASRFDVDVENSFFADAQVAGKVVTLSAFNLSAAHPILRGNERHLPVQTVCIINASSLISEQGELLALNNSMVDLRNGFSAAGRNFAVAREFGKGRVVILADSGFIGGEGTSFPGPGLLAEGDNRIFIGNIISWLGHRL